MTKKSLETSLETQNHATVTKVTLIKSLNKRLAKHQACVHGLGLNKIGDSREFSAITPALQGMINRVAYLLKVETANTKEG